MVNAVSRLRYCPRRLAVAIVGLGCVLHAAVASGQVVANPGGPYNESPGNAISFDGSRSTAPAGQSLSYAWSFGDASTATGVTPTHSYSAAGVYTVTLTVTDGAGAGATATTTATIASAPLANPSGPYSGSAGQTIAFNGSKSTGPAGQVLSYAWSFGDGSTGTGVSPTHIYSAVGSYTVSLTVTDTIGGTSTAATTAVIANVLLANAGGPYTATFGTVIVFSGAKSAGPAGQTLSYAWTFGDGGTGTGVSPTHTYVSVGSYTVTLTVTDSSGGMSKAQATALVVGEPVANAGGPYNGAPGQAVTFSGGSSSGPSGQTLSYAWNFGDGGTGTGVSPAHAYAAAGSYTVSLVVSDSIGGSASGKSTAVIANSPLANAGGPYKGTASLAVAFSASKSTGPAGQTLTYAWSFGDGTTGTGVNPGHSYSAAGTFTVSVTVTGSSGSNTAQTTATIVADTVAVAGGPYSGTVDQAVAFSGAKSTGPSGLVLSYAWKFGDGATGSGVTPSHTYTTANTFAVSLTVTDSSGGTSTANSTAVIAGLTAPIANAGGPYDGVPGQAVSFSGAKSVGPSGQTLTFAWSFGDGGVASGLTPTHSYAAAGSYAVSVKVTSSGGETATGTATATIANAPLANAGGPYNEAPGKAITFDGSKSTGPVGQGLAYAWNFGDGGSAGGVRPVHAYAAAGSYAVSLTVSDGLGGSSTAKTTAAIVVALSAKAGGPYSGVPDQTLTFNGATSTAPPGQTLNYAWTFGDGSSGTGANPIHAYAAKGTYTVSLTVSDALGGTNSASTTAAIIPLVPPTITKFSPSSGPIGTLVTVTGTNLTGTSGPTPVVTLAQQGGGSLAAPLSGFTAASLTFVIPPGAATGPIQVTVGAQNATSASALTVSTSSTFSLGVTPATGKLIQGQSAALAVTVSSTNGFSGLASLSVKGLPAGVTAAFKPAAVAAGQVSVLTLTAPATQAVSTSTLTVSAAATIDSQSVTQSATAAVQVMAISTSFLGRTVVDDAQETPVAGVTVKFLGVTDKGTSTGCTGQTVSDGGGNFMLTGLPTNCVGPQLISYDGSTATAPAGKYAGVNLSYTLVSGQVVASPVLVHLPRIDNGETVEVQQNAPHDQAFYFQTIPGLKVTVYAGTKLSLDDGSQPNPFPLVGIEIPLDRLPDQIASSGMLTPFIVAFQPANAVASQPVAVNFPNPLSTPAGSHVTFVTLDPTHGYMVPYGTGTVSSDGSEFIADADPAYPGHGYGLVHFDWHGPMPPPPPDVNPSPDDPPPPDCGCAGNGSSSPPPATAGGPVDLSSGIVSYTSTDLQISGGRGSIAINRYYRTLASYQGPFGIGTSSSYSYSLGTLSYVDGGGYITLAMPDGNQFVMSTATNGAFTNSTIPSLRGAVLTSVGTSGPYTLRWANGTQYKFSVFTSLGFAGAFLTSITDLNGNTTTLTLNASNPRQIQTITDPVGRTFTLTYDSSNRVTKITDPIGRFVTYTYNSQGTLAIFTDANGGATNYTYDSANNLATITDPRGVVVEQDSYNERFDGRVTKQVEADGGVYQFAYTLLNPGVATSPVLQTYVTDPLGYQTIYRYDTQGFLISVTDASGQTITLTRSAARNNLVSAYTGAGTCPVCGDPTGGNVNYSFDQFGNILSRTDALGNVITFTYDTRFNKVNSITDALNHKTQIMYDANGNPTAIADANGNRTQLGFDSFGELTQINDASGSKTTVSYDGFGNIQSIADANGHATSFAYDAISRLTLAIDALGRKSAVSYNPLNRITSQSDPLGNTTRFTYDGISDLLSFTDAKGNTTQYTYDSVGRLQKRTTPLRASESYKYDVDSNLIQYTDRRGQVSTFQYDELNRLSKENYTDSTVTRGYDATGRLVSVKDSQGGSFGLNYDAAGRLLTQQEPTGTVQYTRDALGRIAARQVVGESAVTYSYDAVGNMLSAATSSVGVTYQYDSRNLPKTFTRTNGVVTSYTFDPVGQVLSIIHSKGATALNTQNYTYDAVGSRSNISTDISQALITQAASALVDDSNELKAFASTVYTYDANGNRLTETSPAGAVAYAWDGRNRLASITDAKSNKTTMQYDFFRNLLALNRSAGNATTQQTFVVDNVTNVISLNEATGEEYSVLTGLGIDSHYASFDTGGNAEFGLEDALGDIAGIVDGTGKLLSVFDYEPYGQATGSISSSYPFAFAGRVSVAGNLDYFRNRYYDSVASRFLSEDPLNPFGGTSEYIYAGDSPVNFSDPTGLYECVYSISNHQMSCTPNNVQDAPFNSKNYVSGNDTRKSCPNCQNNPNHMDVTNHGPLPVGGYIIGPKLPGSLRRPLTPNSGQNMYKRGGFQLHGCGNSATCSAGCIAATTNQTRDLLNTLLGQEEGDNTLQVVP